MGRDAYLLSAQPAIVGREKNGKVGRQDKVEISSQKHIKHENSANTTKPKNNLKTAEQSTYI